MLFIVLLSGSCLFLFAGCSTYNRTKVACVGDSITEGLGLANPSRESYVSLLSTRLGDRYEVRNLGLSGRTLLKSGSAPYWEESEFRKLFEFQPHIITIMLGTNDSEPWSGRHASEFTSDLNAMVDSLQTMKANPTVLLCLPPPVSKEMYRFSSEVISNEIVPIIRQVAKAKGLKVIDVYTPFLDNMDHLPDGVHPDAEGNVIMADVFYKAISALTK